MKTHHQVIIIGGGTAGIMVAAQMMRKKKGLDIALFDPAKYHYYQPAWTLVGANTYKFEKTRKTMASLIPKGIDWKQEAIASFQPENNTVVTGSGTEYTYDFLVVAPGIKIDPTLVDGLPEALDKGVVCSVYTDPQNVWKVFKNFKGGTALFTQPTTPIKCGGAPQKVMYLADDYFRKSGVRDKSNVVYATPGTTIFGVPEIKKTLMEVIDRKDINLRLGHQLQRVDGENKIAWFKMAPHEKNYNPKDLKITEAGDLIGIHFDILHLAPPQSAPDFIRNSPLANDAGWINVDKGTLQHNKFNNVFGLGDAAGLPTAKTGAAVRKQVPVVIENIFRLMDQKGMSSETYNGYSSCPLVTGYGKMVLAEFDYDNNFTPDPKLKQMLIKDSSKEHWRLWILKKYILPYLYWKKMMKGIEV